KRIHLGTTASVHGLYFSADSKQLYYKVNQSLVLFDLKRGKQDVIKNVKSFDKISYRGKDWIIYQTNTSPSKTIIKYISTGADKEFKNIERYFFEDNRPFLLFWVKGKNSGSLAELQCYDLQVGKIYNVYNSDSSADLSIKIDSKNQQMAVILNWGNNKKLLFYKAGDTTATEIPLLENSRSDHLLINQVVRFSLDGERIFVNFKEVHSDKKKKYPANVDVWSYNDPILQSRQLHTLNSSGSFLFSYSLVKKSWSLLAVPGETVLGLPNTENDSDPKIKDDYCIVFTKSEGDIETEWFWNKTAKYSAYLVFTKDGARTLIKDNLVNDRQQYHFTISPDNTYLLYYDADRKNYFSYHIADHKLTQLTGLITTKWTGSSYESYKADKYDTYGGSPEFIDSIHVLVFDRKNIWQLDLTGQQQPQNLTGSLNTNIVFRVEERKKIGNVMVELILGAFNLDNKDDGFFSLKLGNKPALKMLVQEQALFSGTWESKYAGLFPIQKAKLAQKYIVTRQTEKEAPNLYITTDFISFKKLTDYAPQNTYNWMTTELIHWHKPDGSMGQGILYKPENFDPSKKYPLIFRYYEKHTADLHQFVNPNYSYSGQIDIPYYVSNGYLVFSPDIDFTIGKPGESVYNTIVSAAEYLSTLPFVNAKKMGINGHSRGGWETNYLVTHTNLFAAAMEGAGLTNYISMYAGIRSRGTSRQDGMEVLNQRIGATLWEKPERYIENSPIFYADKVTTPLLIVHNKDDEDIPFSEGIELFTSLRRLGKKAWMLQYDNEGHLTFDPDAQRDLTIRQKQFFDFYLMDKPAPKWMLDGVPAKLKNIESRLELDSTGRKPGPGLLIGEK
ncbi:MAG TPA: prolyl oligopeptidase family serine peptidase, partial [Niabella sp.]|nr:prolyl oligopeptidase family serine peptidase [Niabella sp.]